MAIVKTNLVSSSSSSSPLCNVYPNQLKTSSFFVKRSCRLKGLHRKVNFQPLKLQSATSYNSDFYGKRVPINENQWFPRKANYSRILVKAQNGLKLKNAKNWWEKGLQPNMKEVTSAQDLVDSFRNAGDKLVIVEFLSRGCGGCKALHPKIMKFKDALAKHTPDRCSLRPTKGLDEKELVALAANEDLNFTIPTMPANSPPHSNLNPSPLPVPMKSAQSSEEKTLVTLGR